MAVPDREAARPHSERVAHRHRHREQPSEAIVSDDQGDERPNAKGEQVREDAREIAELASSGDLRVRAWPMPRMVDHHEDSAAADYDHARDARPQPGAVRRHRGHDLRRKNHQARQTSAGTSTRCLSTKPTYMSSGMFIPVDWAGRAGRGAIRIVGRLLIMCALSTGRINKSFNSLAHCLSPSALVRSSACPGYRLSSTMRNVI